MGILGWQKRGFSKGGYAENVFKDRLLFGRLVSCVHVGVMIDTDVPKIHAERGGNGGEWGDPGYVYKRACGGRLVG